MLCSGLCEVSGQSHFLMGSMSASTALSRPPRCTLRSLGSPCSTATSVHSAVQKQNAGTALRTRRVAVRLVVAAAKWCFVDGTRARRHVSKVKASACYKHAAEDEHHKCPAGLRDLACPSRHARLGCEWHLVRLVIKSGCNERSMASRILPGPRCCDVAALFTCVRLQIINTNKS